MGASRRGSSVFGNLTGTTSGRGPTALAAPGLASIRSAPASVSTPGAAASVGSSPALTGQENLGINSIASPFGGLRQSLNVKKRSPGSTFRQDIDLPDTRVSLTPGSEDKEEEDTITAPTINDEEKRREAADKASEWLN